MNCSGYERYLDAFADGELDGTAFPAAVEHFHQCPRCAAEIAQIRELRGHLRHAWQCDAAPEGLSVRIVTNLDRAAPPKTLRIPRRTFIRGISALAAAVVVAAGAWLYFGGNWSGSGGTGIAVPGRAAAMVRAQHRLCSAMGIRHHDESLSRDLATVAHRLSERLGFPVIAPDMAAVGFSFVGADACGLAGGPAAHVLYRAASGEGLSVFSAPRMNGLLPESFATAKGKVFVVSTLENMSVMAWHEGGQTYLFCAELPPHELFDVIRTARTALGRP